MANKTVLVVGAAGGIGRAIVHQLLASGWSIRATVLDDAEVEQLRRDVPEVGPVRMLDLADGEAVVDCVRALSDGIDAAIVCAAIGPLGPLETTPVAALRRAFAINSVANLAVYQGCMDALRKSQGRLIMLSSIAGRVGLPFLGSYCTSKFALEALGDVMRREAAMQGVKIVLIEPGAVMTPFIDTQLSELARQRTLLDPAQLARYAHLFDEYEANLRDSQVNGLEAANVATVVHEALEAADPQPRYLVGEQAEGLWRLVSTTPDHDVDQILVKAPADANAVARR